MTLSQFICPHCRSPFQVDRSLPARQIACPHCRQPVRLLNEPPIEAPPLAPPRVLDPPPVEPGTAQPPSFTPRGYSPADLLPPKPAVGLQEVKPMHDEQRESIVEDYRTRQRTADERASRKFVKNMIVWVCCAIVLVSILAFFLTRG